MLLFERASSTYDFQEGSLTKLTVPITGVYYGWVIVVVIGLGGFTQSAESYPILGVFMKPITEEFQWSRTVFSGSTLVGTLVGGVVAIFVGPMIDRVGARWTLTASFAVLGAALVLMAFINAMWQFYLLQIIGRALTMGVLAMALGASMWTVIVAISITRIAPSARVVRSVLAP